MIAKRPRISFRNVFELDQDDLIGDFVKKTVEVKVDEMQTLVKNILLVKKRELEERKLAFSALARKNKNISEGNNFLKAQLDDCFKLLGEKDKQIENVKKQIAELGETNKSEHEYKSLLAEFIEIEEKVNDQKEEIDKLENKVLLLEQEKLLIENDNKQKGELLQQFEENFKKNFQKLEEELNKKNCDIKFLEKEVRAQIKEKISFAEEIYKKNAKIDTLECQVDTLECQFHINEKGTEAMMKQINDLNEDIKTIDGAKQREIKELKVNFTDAVVQLEEENEKKFELTKEAEKNEISTQLKESFKKLENLKTIITNKEELVENMQKALDEQLSKYEVQNEQNSIYRQEHENNIEELRKYSIDNQNLQNYIANEGEFVGNRDQQINAISVALELKEEELNQIGIKSREKIHEQKLCKLCMVEDVSTVFLPCGHLCCCNNCANLPAVKNCPICRVAIQKSIKVYQS